MLFIDNKYTHWYYAIIRVAQNRTLAGTAQTAN
jgi:hypothetical protein